MKSFFKHILIEFKLGLRDQTIVLMNFLFPLLFFFFMGSVMTNVNPAYKEIMLPSMLLFMMLSATVLVVPNYIVANRETGIYRSFKIYGVSKIKIILITVVTNLINILLVYVIITLVSHYLFKVDMPTHLIRLIGITLLFYFASISIAIFIGIITKSSKHVVLFSQLIFLPSILLGGVMLPLSTLPKSMVNVSFVIPSAHAMNLIEHYAYSREATINGPLSIIVLLTFTVLFFILDLIMFKFDNR